MYAPQVRALKYDLGLVLVNHLRGDNLTHATWSGSNRWFYLKFRKKYKRVDDSVLTSPRESTVEETNSRYDVDWLGVVRRGLRNNFGNRQLFEEFRRVCSEGAVSPVRTLGQHAHCGNVK